MKVYLLVTLAMLPLSATSAKEDLPPELEMLSPKRTKCTHERAYDMSGANCAGLKLSTIPNTLKSGIEILDASDNKIRELRDNTFSSYTSIKYLYLADNSIYLIDQEAFTPLSSIEALDLSNNALTSIPNTLLNIPSLRKLYLTGNALIYLKISLNTLEKPIKAPLQHPDLADCRITELPDIGILPQLQIYNVSKNPLTKLEAVSFARTCQLATVDLTNSLSHMPLCSLKLAISWISQQHINFLLNDYSSLNSDEFYVCPEEKFGDDLNRTYASCKAAMVQMQQTTYLKQKWISITGGLFGFLVAFILLLYLMHRKNVAQTKKIDKKAAIPKTETDNRATDSLLKGVS